MPSITHSPATCIHDEGVCGGRGWQEREKFGKVAAVRAPRRASPRTSSHTLAHLLQLDRAVHAHIIVLAPRRVRHPHDMDVVKLLHHARADVVPDDAARGGGGGGE